MSKAHREVDGAAARGPDPRLVAFLAELDGAERRAVPHADLASVHAGVSPLVDPAELRAQAVREPAPLELEAEVAGGLRRWGVEADPECVVLLRSEAAAMTLALRALGPGEVLAPCTSAWALAGAASAAGVGVRRYALRCDGSWSLDRDALLAGVGPLTRALVTSTAGRAPGAALPASDTRAIAHVCDGAELPLVVDGAGAELAAPATLPRTPGATPTLWVSHLFELPPHAEDLALAWVAVAGPPGVARAVADRVRSLAGAGDVPGAAARGAGRQLLAGRAALLGALADRARVNLAVARGAAVREAPWAVLSGAGPWALLEVGAGVDEVALCRELLAEGVAVLPGALFDLPREGLVAVSLLATPDAFAGGLARLERRLR